MRVVREAARAAEELRAARDEALASFGDPSVYVERYLERPRHVELQILADRHGAALCLGERECSIQRRHQKLIEESPSPAAPREEVEMAGQRAAAMCVEAGYAGAATFEFLMDDRGHLTFMEVNTRLQVEHPITEARFGVDLVEQQIRIAAGRPLPGWLVRRRPRGAAVEARVYAEDPEQGFLPAAGRLEMLHLPSGPGVRCDSGVYSGYRVPLEYDALLAKIVTWGETRRQALARMRRALEECTIGGLPSTLPFLRWTLADPEFRAGRYSTWYISERWDRRHELCAPAGRAAAAAGGAGGSGASGGGGRRPPLRLWAALAAAALETRRGAARAQAGSARRGAWAAAFAPRPFEPGGGWSGRRRARDGGGS
jgi:acetyl-CoA carboxylase biotin carboxylase subunit